MNVKLVQLQIGVNNVVSRLQSMKDYLPEISLLRIMSQWSEFVGLITRLQDLLWKMLGLHVSLRLAWEKGSMSIWNFKFIHFQVMILQNSNGEGILLIPNPPIKNLSRHMKH